MFAGGFMNQESTWLHQEYPIHRLFWDTMRPDRLPSGGAWMGGQILEQVRMIPLALWLSLGVRCRPPWI